MATAYLLCGPSLAGKSTLAGRIAQRYGASIVSADEINARRGLPFGGEGLPESVWAETLRLQLEALRKAGAEGASIVVDDTACYRWLRDRLRDTARAAALVPLLLVVRPPRDELLARHAALTRAPTRAVLSRARMEEHLTAFEWPGADEQPIDLSDPSSVEAWLAPGDGPDRWLDVWMPQLRAHWGAAAVVLELGCGAGRDSVDLAAAGAHLIGIDASAAVVAQARARVPSGEFHPQDLRAPFPASATRLGVVVASLSLHYFAWDETLALLHRIRDALRPGGVLLCRVNSTRDHHHGASGHPRIDANYYRVNGEAKRFFDGEALARLFAEGWQVRHRVERCIDRYAHPKWVWEILAERTAPQGSIA